MWFPRCTWVRSHKILITDPLHWDVRQISKSVLSWTGQLILCPRNWFKVEQVQTDCYLALWLRCLLHIVKLALGMFPPCLLKLQTQTTAWISTPTSTCTWACFWASLRSCLCCSSQCSSGSSMLSHQSPPPTRRARIQSHSSRMWKCKVGRPNPCLGQQQQTNNDLLSLQR